MAGITCTSTRLRTPPSKEGGCQLADRVWRWSRPEQNKWVQYLDAIYWALTTLTTVGYGDVVPHNNMERAYTLVVLLVGAIVFGFLLSSLGELLSNVDPTRVRIDEKMNEVKQFLSWHSVPMELTLAVRRYYDYYLSHRFIANEKSC